MAKKKETTRSIKIHCLYDEMLPLDKINKYEKNPNKHGSDQIERLAKIYEYTGVRHPIVICKDRNVIAAGHCRLASAIRAGMEKFPVVYQKFETDEQFYAFVASDNAIALWADLDLSAINLNLESLGPDFDLDFLGIDNFTLDISEKEFDPSDSTEIEKDRKTCPSCGELL